MHSIAWNLNFNSFRCRGRVERILRIAQSGSNKESSYMETVSLKILIIGDSGTGKSRSLIHYGIG